MKLSSIEGRGRVIKWKRTSMGRGIARRNRMLIGYRGDLSSDDKTNANALLLNADQPKKLFLQNL